MCAFCALAYYPSSITDESFQTGARPGSGLPFGLEIPFACQTLTCPFMPAGVMCALTVKLITGSRANTSCMISATSLLIHVRIIHSHLLSKYGVKKNHTALYHRHGRTIPEDDVFQLQVWVSNFKVQERHMPDDAESLD